MATNGIHRIEEKRIDKNRKEESSIEDIKDKSDSRSGGLKSIIDFYNNNIGLLTPYGLELLEDYLNEMDSDVVIYAMQLAVEADKKTIKYIKAILNNWSNSGIKTLIEAKKENQRFKDSKNKEESEEEKTKRKIKELEDLMNANK